MSIIHSQHPLSSLFFPLSFPQSITLLNKTFDLEGFRNVRHHHTISITRRTISSTQWPLRLEFRCITDRLWNPSDMTTSEEYAHSSESSFTRKHPRSIPRSCCNLFATTRGSAFSSKSEHGFVQSTSAESPPRMRPQSIKDGSTEDMRTTRSNRHQPKCFIRGRTDSSKRGGMAKISKRTQVLQVRRKQVRTRDQRYVRIHSRSR